MNVLIMAGGTGTRLWPASRKHNPKQLLKLIGEKTLLQNTYQRSRSWVGAEQIYLGTAASYVDSARQQLPDLPLDHYSIEPCLRARGPAIGLAALIMHAQNPDANFICMWSDHAISAADGYFPDLLAKLDQFLASNPKATITVGVKPEYPHPGLGYIEKGAPLENSLGLPVYQVSSFKEKPDLSTAQEFVDSGNYLWNSGYFCWKASTLLELYQTHMPEIYDLLMQIKPHLGTPEQQKAIDEIYPQMPTVDIEQGLLEKIRDNIFVLEGNFNWSDIGSWKVVKESQSPGEDNVTEGLVVAHNTADSLLYNYSDRAVLASVGNRDIIVVVTDEAVLVADKGSSEEVKKIIAQLEQDENLKKYL